MNILIVGSGAREHAIARALSNSPQKPTLYCCALTNNPGIEPLCKEYWIGNISDADEIPNLAKDWKIDLAIIGPEAPLEKGIADALWAINIPVVGPKKKLANLETSKSFTRDLLAYYQIPGSPQYRVFYNLVGVKDFLQELGEGGYVIKADGLMGGKGVKVAGDHLHSFEEAYEFCEELHADNQAFVIEEKLIGQEFSFMCFCDGEHLIPMPLVQDHKRAFENDKGPNTGGMGSYSDATHSLPFLSKEDIKAAQQINLAVIEALKKECDERYIGILYGSFIATRAGIKLIEYNARFGDPESLNVLSILESDFVEVCKAMVSNNLSRAQVQFAPLATVCKYAVPKGYPDQPEDGALIDVSGVQYPERLFFAAVNEKDGKIYTTRSRAVAVVGVAKTISEAEEIAEQEINRIKGALYHRKDIGREVCLSCD